jgi:hypothetical protein
MASISFDMGTGSSISASAGLLGCGCYTCRNKGHILKCFQRIVLAHQSKEIVERLDSLHQRRQGRSRAIENVTRDVHLLYDVEPF